ncbi:hypothetical protein C5D65_10115 [Rathayibacter toxicus]|nr:hypothetical protein C5D15_10145 [Rathayibacter toxicus]PPH62504.1 hypothetical protein C5D13_10205 [Rathayibacter toxicus]PPI29697.1 hypothetical protein C5D65_10115 [Rathayibacter toxicus]PPI44338.1 hypothetical protein C5D43_10100 [Rathayibacter toxicus]QWL50448.1 hypothetical protein E2R44_01270 [Rathayibacter toxicus]
MNTAERCIGRVQPQWVSHFRGGGDNRCLSIRGPVALASYLCFACARRRKSKDQGRRSLRSVESPPGLIWHTSFQRRRWGMCWSSETWGLLLGVPKTGSRGRWPMSASPHWLAVFDMDGTLLPNTTAAQEIAQVAGVLQEIRELEARYSAGHIDSLEFSALALRLWESGGDSVYRSAWEASPKIDNIDTALAELRRSGGYTVLVTMAPVEFARHFTAFDEVFGSAYGCRIINPEDKPIIVEEIRARRGIAQQNVVAFGDSYSDIPLFREVAQSVAVNGTVDIESLATYSYRGADLSEAVAVLRTEVSA